MGELEEALVKKESVQSPDVENLNNQMKQLQSPSSKKYTYEQVEKECKRLKVRNEKLVTTVEKTNEKNRQYQSKLKKYYNLCNENGLLSQKKSISKPDARAFGGENTINKS